MDTPEYLAEQLRIAESHVQRYQEAGDGPELGWWKARLEDLERRAQRLQSTKRMLTSLPAGVVQATPSTKG